MIRGTIFILAALLALTALPAPAAAQGGVLVWRLRQSALEQPKASSTIHQCNGDYCSTSIPLESAEPIELKAGYYYSEEFDPGCADGVVRVDSRWNGSSKVMGLELLDGGKLLGGQRAGAGANEIVWEQPFAAGGRLTALVYNEGSATVDVHRFGQTVGCSVRVHDLQVWLEHNVMRGGRKGMVIHTSFGVENQRGAATEVVAYFNNSAGQPLRDSDGDYRTTTGKVSVGDDVQPAYDYTTYDDVDLFLPYGELHLASGRRHDLSAQVALFDAATDTQLAISTPVSFWYN